MVLTNCSFGTMYESSNAANLFAVGAGDRAGQQTRLGVKWATSFVGDSTSVRHPNDRMYEMSVAALSNCVPHP